MLSVVIHWDMKVATLQKNILPANAGYVNSKFQLEILGIFGFMN